MFKQNNPITALFFSDKLSDILFSKTISTQYNSTINTIKHINAIHYGQRGLPHEDSLFGILLQTATTVTY